MVDHWIDIKDWVESLPENITVVVAAMEGPIIDVDESRAHMSYLWAEAKDERNDVLQVRRSCL